MAVKKCLKQNEIPSEFIIFKILSLVHPASDRIKTNNFKKKIKLLPVAAVNHFHATIDTNYTESCNNDGFDDDRQVKGRK